MLYSHCLLFATARQAYYAQMMFSGGLEHFGITETLWVQQQGEKEWSIAFHTERQICAGDQRLLLARSKWHTLSQFNKEGRREETRKEEHG